jgi:hypothetical protein
MICPACQTEFKGGAFTSSNGPGTSKRMRECPNGHKFEEPAKTRRSDAKDARRYRWLRDKGGGGWAVVNGELLEGAELDTLIDTALINAPR